MTAGSATGVLAGADLRRRGRYRSAHLPRPPTNQAGEARRHLGITDGKMVEVKEGPHGGRESSVHPRPRMGTIRTDRPARPAAWTPAWSGARATRRHWRSRVPAGRDPHGDPLPMGRDLHLRGVDLDVAQGEHVSNQRAARARGKSRCSTSSRTPGRHLRLAELDGVDATRLGEAARTCAGRLRLWSAVSASFRRARPRKRRVPPARSARSCRAVLRRRRHARARGPG